MEISWSVVIPGCVALTFIGKIIHGIFSTALEKRDTSLKTLSASLDLTRDAHDADVKALRATQKLIFAKHDALVKELHEYKLHVAETYVAEAKLEKMLQPIERRLEAIENDLRGGGGRK